MEDLVRSTSFGRAAIPNRYRPAATPRSQKRDPGPPTYCSSSPFGGDGSSGPLPRKNLRAAGRTADPSTSLRYGRDDKGGAVCFGNFVWRMRQMVTIDTFVGMAPPQLQKLRSRVRYCMASAMWPTVMASSASRSAMVRATFNIRSCARALRPCCCIARSSSRSASGESSQ